MDYIMAAPACDSMHGRNFTGFHSLTPVAIKIREDIVNSRIRGGYRKSWKKGWK